MATEQKSVVMEHPFAKSVSAAERVQQLIAEVGSDDTLAVLINADPDAMASALALKRLFWRRAKKILIYHINPIKRADNLAFVRLLKVDQQHIRNLDRAAITKWAILDSQPHHEAQFRKYHYDIIIDHHPLGPGSRARFVDIREEYGANATIMTEYLRAARIKPSPRLATALFYGIKTDTDNFVRQATGHDINAFRYLYRFVKIVEVCLEILMEAALPPIQRRVVQEGSDPFSPAAVGEILDQVACGGCVHDVVVTEAARIVQAETIVMSRGQGDVFHSRFARDGRNSASVEIFGGEGVAQFPVFLLGDFFSVHDPFAAAQL